MDVPLKKASSTFAASKPVIGPVSRPSARAAMIRYAPCRVPLRKACSRRPSCGPSNHALASVWGNRYGSFSWNSRSWPTITVTGASMVLARLPSSSAGSSRALASGERTNTKRAGDWLALVGPHLSSS